MDFNSSSEATGINPEERLQAKIRRLCEAPQNGPLKTVFVEKVWPELEESYGMMARAMVEYWKRRLVEHRIPAMVEGRQKSAESIRKSMNRREQARISRRSAGPYESLEEIFYDVHDLAGIRIVVDFTPQVEEVVKRIKQSFMPTKAPSIWPPGRPVGQLWSALFGAYQGSNHPVKFDSDIDDKTLQRYSDVTVEIQVTSLAESLYNRLAHPLLYKKVSGTLSRKEEMVIDLSHGLALCYSICLLLMQDKLEQPPQSAEQPAMLWGAIRGAAITPGEGEQDKHLAALADQMPGPVPHDSSPQISNEGGSLSSANPVLPVATCLNMLHHARAREPSPDQLWEWMAISLKNAVQEAAKPPILLPTWEQARFDSEDVQSRPKCYEGTQNDARSRIKAWVKDSQAPTLFWVHAPVGTGKSTLARTIIDDLSKDGNLAAGYFFRRGDVDRNNISRIFPTIAIQLLETVPAFEPLLRKSTNAHSSEAILSTSLENQFDMLLKTPLSGMPPVSQDKPAMAIIIDGLDESNRNKSPSWLLRLLRLLASLEAVKCLRLCVLITSRKAHAIPDAFENLKKEGQSYCELALDEEYKVQMTAEIRQYLASEFRAIKQRKGILVDPWPTPKDFDLLVSEATRPSPLFIYASTLIGFVNQTKLGCEPTAQLQNWVDGCYRKESRLDEMYTQILSDITECDHEAESKLLDIVGSIASLERPLSAKALAGLLDISEGVMSDLLKNLQAVLHVPGDKEEPVTLAHDSFRSFLFRTHLPGKTSSFRISKPEAHRTLATKCRNRMVRRQGGLRKDVCGFSNLAIEWNDIPPGVVGDHIPIDLQYACLYWAHHLGAGEHVDQAETYEFLAHYFPPWVETLSLLGSVGEVQAAIKQLESLVKQPRLSFQTSSNLASFIRDAKAFIDRNAAVIETMPLEVYGSTLVFSPPGSKVRQLFYDGRLMHIHDIKSGFVKWDTLSQRVFYSIEVHPPPQEAKTTTDDSPGSAPQRFMAIRIGASSIPGSASATR